MRFLCGIDESATGRAVANAAAQLARRMGAELTLTHVASTTAGPPAAHTASPGASLDLQRMGVRAPVSARELDALADDIAVAYGTRPDVYIAYGDTPAERLRAAAQAVGCDLVVLGATPRGRLAGALGAARPGAMAVQVDCPVMVVPRGTDSPAGDCVAVAYDDSSISGAAAAVAARLASALGGCLTIIHVLADPRSCTHPVLPMQRDAQGVVEATLDGEQLDLQHVWAYGLPAAHLAQTVAGVQPTLLVVAAPTRRHWRNLFRPSVSTQLLRRAWCPVVIVPEGSAVHANRATVAAPA